MPTNLVPKQPGGSVGPYNTEIEAVGILDANGVLCDLQFMPNGRLKVDASITVEHVDIGNVGVLDSSEIRINPATEETLQDILSALGGTVGNFHEYDSAVANSVTETTILTYTVPALKTARVDILVCTGTSDAMFTLKLGGNIKLKGRTAWTDRNFQSSLGTLVATAGQVITVTAYHSEFAQQTFYVTVGGQLS